MAQISRPVGYGLLAIVSVAVVWFSNQGSTVTAAPPKADSHKTSRSMVQADFIAEDYNAHFDKTKGKFGNLFLPLVANEAINPAPQAHQDIETIPSAFANGEANWKYTGMAEINGARSALLQDTEKHHGGFVAEGAHWKSSKLLRITSESVVLADAHGQQQVVMRFSLNKPKGAAGTAPTPETSGPQPVNPVMHGPIGPNNIVISPMPAVPGGPQG